MKKYAVGINGEVVVWENGKFKCENTGLLKKIKAEADEFSRNPMKMISLDGSVFSTGGKYNPEESWSASFALLQEMTGNNLEFIAGDRPTWEAMGYETPKDAVS